MKKTALLSMGFILSLVSPFLVVDAQAEIFRPYVTCVSNDKATHVEVKQNVDKSAEGRLFVIDIARPVSGKKSTFTEVATNPVPHKHKALLEWFEGTSGQYHFNLMVLKGESLEGFKSYLIDNYGRRTVYCNYHVTFGN